MRHFVFVLSLLALLISPTFAQETALRGFVQVQIDIPRPYLGQTVLYTARLFVAEGIPLEQVNFIPPDFAGFGQSSQVLPATLESRTQSNTVFNVTTQQYILYPLRAGDLEISPYQMIIPNNSLSAGERFQSNRLMINVQALPEGAPTNFRNAVGQFEIDADIRPTTITFGASVSLVLEVRGSGNLEQILAPVLDLPPDWRSFEGETTYEQNTPRFATKTFTWTVFPVGIGTVNFNPLSFSYFDPQTQRYETRSTVDRLLLRVVAPREPTATPTPRPSRTPNPEASQAATEVAIVPSATVAILASPTEAISNAVATNPPANTLTTKVVPNQYMPPVPSLTFWLLWLIAPAITLILWGAKYVSSGALPSRSSGGNQGSTNLRQAYQRLKNLSVENPKVAYQEINDTIMQYLSRKAAKPVTDSNLADSISHLPTEIREHLLHCIHESESGQYAPVQENDATLLISRTRQSLREVDKAW